ncbi:uncharacterized protein LOC125377312 [Haliotis rufescens]|uniref:uncharacterized protein LOC125377312 n=1 Tax=Haliotis rufescens TaxID=6454 RepID=UPI00201F71EA|nr:uncharacterized protein LOC125377312 [Haliotis rufescens]
MTQGAGGVSSGGGVGGFSGGGFNRHHHHITHHTSEVGEGGGECGKRCCFFVVLGINIISFTLCIRKMSRYLRIALLWLYVATAVLTAGLLISLRILGTNKFKAAPTDMRKVETGVNNAFCESYTLKSSDPFEAFIFDKEPVVDPRRIEEFSTSYVMSLQSNNYNYWGFYLLPGSTLQVNSTNDVAASATPIVIQGDSNLQTWLDSKGDCSDCYIYKQYMLRHHSYTMNCKETDNYFFVYINGGIFDVSSTANVFIRRTLYDVTKATSACAFLPGQRSCRFDMSINLEQSLVFHSGRRALNQSIDMSGSCGARAWMYVIVFALIPILVAGSVSFLIWMFCKDDKTEEKQALVPDPGSKEQNSKLLTKNVLVAYDTCTTVQ